MTPTTPSDSEKLAVLAWLDETEGFGTRMERLVEDLANGADIIPWLVAAAALTTQPVPAPDSGRQQGWVDGAREAFKKALMSYMFGACQPDKGNVFGWVDDHSSEIADFVLAALTTQPVPVDASAGKGDDLRETRAYRDGMRAGFRMGESGEAGRYEAALAKMQAEITEAALQPAPAPDSGSLSSSSEAHFSDPCNKCGVGHDDVAVGPCPADGIVISRVRAKAVLDVLNSGRGPSGWPTPLWAEVQAFKANLLAALPPANSKEPG